MSDFNFTQIQLDWIHDLKTTKEPQTTGALHRADGSMCCLGRALKVCGITGVLDPDIGVYQYQPDPDASERSWYHGVLPEPQVAQLGLRGVDGPLDSSELPQSILDELSFGCFNLTEFNDHLGWSFAQIGEFLETYPKAVFK